MSAIEIREDDLSGQEIAALLSHHLAFSARQAPAESDHALDLDGLRGADVTFWSVWQGGALVGCGALKELTPDHGEIKSMHTVGAHRGQGIGGRLLDHLIGEARRRGYRRLSLETGAMDGYAAARALYMRFGFTECAPFADYREDPHSTFMTLALDGKTDARASRRQGEYRP